MTLTQVPLSEGLKVCAFGLSGVFIALGLLATGLKVISVVLRYIDSRNMKKES